MDDSHIPIDINSNKLLEWLISRRHVSKDWQQHILPIREKINNAIQDMPAHDGIVKLLSGQHINYFHCLKIVEILKETEADTKNLFGRYGSQRMKDWQDIVSTYQRDNIYLAEAAQILIRNVSYEVPSLRKQIAKLQQSQQEAAKKIKDYSRAENIAQNDFNATCKQLGIEGLKIKPELIKLLDELPAIYQQCAENVKTIQPALDLYNAFINFHSGKNSDLQALPLLTYLIKYGNTTTYEYTYGEKPVAIEEPTLNIDDDEAKMDSIENIDFGVNVQIDFGGSGEIDFGSGGGGGEIDFGNTPLSEGEIDWGTVTTDEEFEMVEHVDFDINLEESGIVVEKSGLDGGTARDTDAYTIFDNPRTRDQILNDLLELEAFLKLRLYEISCGGDGPSVAHLDAPTALQMETIKSVTSLNDLVSVMLSELTSKRLQHLHNIKHSPKYVDILTATLKQKLQVVERMQSNKKVLEDKIKDMSTESVSVEPVIKKIVDRTKQLQVQIQDDISKKYKGRVVNIIGAVNMM